MPTTHTTPIDLRGYHGREFEGVINGEKCKGRISIDAVGDVMLCQNVYNGANPSSLSEFNYYGYKYTCIAQFSGQIYWTTINLTSITILDPPSSIDPRWDWKDGEIVTNEGVEYEVCFMHKKIIALRDIETNEASGSLTLPEAYGAGYRKLPSPPTRKLTEITEDMFDKTNLIGRKVVYEDVEYTITGMNIGCGNRFVVLPGVPSHTIIHKCKLIEE
jgi:hypothetical protein